MSTSRVDHTATKLLDGTILITGGRDGSLTSLSSAELFDPSDDSLSSAGTMTHARNRHTAELLPDGTVIVAGAGYGSADTNTSELYDSGTWTAKGNLLDGRTGAICMTISGVAVFLAGIPSNTPVMSYDSATGQWSGLATAVVVRNIASSGATVFSVPFPTLSDSIAAPRLCQGPNKDVYVYCANSTGTSVFVGRVTAAGTTPWSGGGVTISSLLAPSISIDGMVRCCKTAAGIAVVYTKDKGTGVAAIYYRHLSEVDGSAIVTETQVCASPTSTVRDWVHTVSYKRGSTLILGERATHPSTLPIQQTITKVLDNGTIVYSNTADGLDRSSPIDDLWPSFHPNEFRANGRMPAITVHPTYYVGFTASSNFALRLYKLPATGVYQGVNATSAWSSELAAANQTTTNAYSTILAHPDGTGIYVVWHERKTGSPFADRVYCAKYLWDGTQSWKTYVSNSGFEANTNGPAKAVLTSSGKVAIAWDSNGSGSLRLYAQMVDTDGSVLFTAGGLQVSAGTVVTAFELQAGIADDMILVWPISTTAFDAQRVDSSGTKLWNSGSPLHPLTGLSSALVRTSARDVSGGMWFGYQTSSRAWGIKLSQTGVVSGPMRILPDATAWAAVVPFMFPSTNGDVFVVGRGVSPELNSQLINRITASGTYPWGSVAGIRFEPGYQTDPHRQIDSSGNGMTAGYDHAKLNAGASEGALWMYHTDFTTGVIDRPTAADYGGLYQINFNTTETANNSNFFYVGHLDPSGYNVFMCRERPNTTTGNNWYMALMYMKNGVVKNYIRQLHGHPIQTTAISTGSFDSGEGVELRGLGGLQYGTFTLPEIIDQINSVSAAFDLVFGYGMSTYGLDTTFKIQFGATVYSRTLPVYHEASPTDTASLLQYAFNHASAPAEMPPSPVTVQWDETTGKFKVISSANFTLIGSGETRGGAWTMLGFEPFANTVATLTGPLEISTTGRGERRRHQCWVAALGTTYVLPVANGSVATQNLMALLGFGPGDLTLGDALAPTPKFPV